MPALSRVGDQNQASGAIKRGAGSVYANGIAVGLHVSGITPHAPWGRPHPPHQAATTTEGSPTVFANGIKVGLHVSTMTPHSPWGRSHPPHRAATTTSGSPTVFCEGSPVLRVGSGNSCGHSIVQGSPDVFVP